jgi:hypothetical protein
MAVAAIVWALPFACSTPENLQGNGGQCTQTTDCQPNLFCVPQKVGPGICTNNLSTIVSTEEAGATIGDGAPKGDAPAPGDGGTTPPDGGGSIPEAQPPADNASPPPEAAAPPPDAGD